MGEWWVGSVVSGSVVGGECGGWVHVGTVCRYCVNVWVRPSVCVCLACTSVFNGLLPVSMAPSILPCSTLRKSWDQLKSG